MLGGKGRVVVEGGGCLRLWGSEGWGASVGEEEARAPSFCLLVCGGEGAWMREGEVGCVCGGPL